MTRRKRTPPPEAPSKRAAFQIPNSLAQLSAISRSLANRDQQESVASNIVARAQAQAQAQALANSSPSDPQPPKAIRWKHDQKDFPNAQTWITPLEARWKERQAQELTRPPDSSTTPTTTMIRQSPSSAGVAAAQTQLGNAARVNSMQAPARKPINDSPVVAGQKRKMGEFAHKHQRKMRALAESRAPKVLDKDIENRRQAIVDRLKATNAASVPAAGTNIQVPNRLPQTEDEEEFQPEPEAEEPLDMVKDAGEISNLIAHKRAQNAQTGQLGRLLELQQEHRQKEYSRAVSNTMPAFTRPPPPPFPVVGPNLSGPSNFASNAPAQQQPRLTTAQVQRPPSGYAEASTTNLGVPEGEDPSDLDLRSLFSSPHQTPNSEGSEEDETARVLRNAIQGQTAQDFNSSRRSAPDRISQPNRSDAASPSAQLLTNLANASTAALARTTPQNSSPYTPVPTHAPVPFPANKAQQLANTSRQRPPQRKLQQSSSLYSPDQNVMYNANQSPYVQPYARPVTAQFAPKHAPKPPVKLTPEQQEMRLIRQHTERSQQEEKVKELRKKAEDRAKVVQEQNKRKQEQQSTPAKETSKSQAAGSGSSATATPVNSSSAQVRQAQYFPPTLPSNTSSDNIHTLESNVNPNHTSVAGYPVAGPTWGQHPMPSTTTSHTMSHSSNSISSTPNPYGHVSTYMNTPSTYAHTHNSHNSHTPIPHPGSSYTTVGSFPLGHTNPWTQTAQRGHGSCLPTNDMGGGGVGMYSGRGWRNSMVPVGDEGFEVPKR
jgi:hypothetical protein